MATLTVLLPGARDRCGRAVLTSRTGELLLGPFRVLGSASRHVSRRMGNPTHDRLLPFGDPPAGTYVIASSLPPGAIHSRRPGRFGKLGALVLEPTGGEALAAMHSGRDRIVLHGGPLDAQRRLRRTRGGLRVPNRMLAALFQAINRAHADGDPVSAVDVVDVASGFESEPSLTTTRRVRRTTPRARSSAALAALAVFGTAREPTRRGFLAAFLVAAGATALSACEAPAPCAHVCDHRTGSGSGSGSSAPRSSTGSGSGSDEVRCYEVCGGDGDDDYGVGGGVG